MSKREAIDTIRGYYYQFDLTILKLLSLDNHEETITIEGIEDIDIKSINEETAIQCKYYEKTEYNHSVIAKPIRLMLDHFKEVKSGLKPYVKYYLYGHYKSGQEKLYLPITIEFLKKHFLAYTKDKKNYQHQVDLGLSDKDLEEFLSILTINIRGISYEEQLKNLKEKLASHFNCSSFQTENFYYNNAIAAIKELATRGNKVERTISKKDFLETINTKQILFNEWFILYKGKKDFLANLRKEYFSKLNISPFERFFLLEINPADYKRSDLKDIIFQISKKWSNISRRSPEPFCPYIYIHNISTSEFNEVKRELYSEGFKFNDGYSFYGAEFSTKSITEPATFHNQIKIKIVNKLEHLEIIFKETRRTKEVYQLYTNTPFYSFTHQNIKHIKIQLENLLDIKEII